MALLDFLNPSDEEIKKRTANALANAGKPEDLNALKREEDLKTLPAQPLPGLGGTTGPSPASVAQPQEVSPNRVPQGNWAQKAGVAAPTANPYADAFKTAGQVASYMPSGGVEMQKTATKNLGDIQAQGFADREGVYKEQEIANDESQARLKQVQAEKEAAQKEFDSKYDAAKKEVDGMEVDSDRFWKNASTGKKIMTGIGLALSAFGGPEAVARTSQIIQKSIDNDIEEQKAAYGMKKEGLKDMSNVYARMMDKYGDKEKAELATRALYNEKVQSKIQQIADRTNRKAAKENATNAIGQLQSQKDGIVAQLGINLASTANSKPVEYGKTIPDNYTPKNAEEAKSYVPGIGLATDPEAAKTLRPDSATFSNFNSGVNKLIKMREKYGSETMPTDAKGEMKQIYNELLLDKKSMAKLGVMSESDLEMLQNIVADPTSFNPSTLARLKALQADGVGKFQRNINPYLMNPVQSLGMKFKSGQF